MDTQVLILRHDTPGLREGIGNKQCLIRVDCGSRQSFAKVGFFTVTGDGEALDRADIDAGVTLDAARREEGRLDVAVQTTLHFARRLLRVEAQFNLDMK